MAKPRKGVAYRRLERPYTRFSKFSTKSFVRARPVSRVVRYDMGTEGKNFEYSLFLTAKASLQIRDISIESARQTSNRLLEKRLAKTDYKMKLLLHPHHVLRENPLAAGAGADRMSTGMAHSFGKPIGIAAQVKQGKNLIRVDVNTPHLDIARAALKRAQYKLPCSCSINVIKNVLKNV